jgi:multidrug efflux pump subunit AcrA (membrane-fusion protein)
MQFRGFSHLAILLTVAIVSGCDADTSSMPETTPTTLPVRVAKVKRRDSFTYPVVFFGRIQPHRKVTIAFEIPGQIVDVKADEGEIVDAGQELARLDTTILDAERKRLVASKSVELSILRKLENGERNEVIAAAKANAAEVESELTHATLVRDRLKRLAESNSATISEYEAAAFKAKALQASLNSAEARLLELRSGARQEDIEAQMNRLSEIDAQVEILDVRLKKAIVRAPFRCHILCRSIDEGAVIEAGQLLMVISEANLQEARFSIPSVYLDHAIAAKTIVTKGSLVNILSVRFVSEVSDEIRTVDVIYELESTSKLFSGQTCELSLIETVPTECVELPVSALVPSVRGLWSVYRLVVCEKSGNYRVLREEVTINHTDGQDAYVEGTIPADTFIVLEGVHKLVPGMEVRIMDKQP